MTSTRRHDEAAQDGDGAARRRRSGPRRRLTQKGIVDAAIQVIESDGLTGLSMRRLADALGVVPGTLYTYVTDRTALLTLVMDTVVEHDDLPHELPGAWREKLEAWARSDFDGFCARPWVLDLRASVHEFGPNMVTWLDSALRVFEEFDVSEDTKLDMIGALDAYILGSAFARLEAIMGDRPARGMERAVATAYETSPALQTALGQVSRTFDSERFEFGLRCLLDGFAATLATTGTQSE